MVCNCLQRFLACRTGTVLGRPPSLAKPYMLFSCALMHPFLVVHIYVSDSSYLAPWTPSDTWFFWHLRMTVGSRDGMDHDSAGVFFTHRLYQIFSLPSNLEASGQIKSYLSVRQHHFISWYFSKSYTCEFKELNL